MLEYSKEVKKLGILLLELLSEALDLNPDYLNALGCSEGHAMLCHYYPACPEPEKTLGAGRHADYGFLTVLLQDGIGGLQVLCRNQWVDVPPVRGALVVNIGDLLQACIELVLEVSIIFRMHIYMMMTCVGVGLSSWYQMTSWRAANTGCWQTLPVQESRWRVSLPPVWCRRRNSSDRLRS